MSDPLPVVSGDDFARRLHELLDDDDPMSKELGRVMASVMECLDQVVVAENEADEFARRHPDRADDLHHAKALLEPTVEPMRTDFVYLAHVRELLQRVVDGEDTREPTNVEVSAACRETSLHAPLSTAGIVIYTRAFYAAFPDKAAELFPGVIDLDSYLHVAGGEADILERGLRRKLTVPHRTLKGVTCSGRHNGEPASTCRYFKPEQLGLPLAD